MIFYVEDDNGIRDLILYTLESVSLQAKGFSCSKDMFKALEKEIPDLFILDIMLPDEDGIQILQKLRKNPNTKHLPIMLATAKNSEFDKVYGLDIGADDYITKPFGMMELVARIKALLRRTAVKTKENIIVGDIQINPDKHTVYANGSKIELTKKEFNLLYMLMEYPERVFTRDNILSTIWGYDFDGETRTVDVHVRTLRQKLGACGDQLRTIRGVGYAIKTNVSSDKSWKIKSFGKYLVEAL